MKSYTDIDQSEKLAEILPHESADMCWTNHYYGTMRSSMRVSSLTIKEYKELLKRFADNTSIDVFYPCWSLAALLSVLPFHLIINNQRYAFSMHKGLNKYGETYMFRYNVFNTDVCLYSTDHYNNAIDACYEMILKLHELKML